jgi:hypothetical protein
MKFKLWISLLSNEIFQTFQQISNVLKVFKIHAKNDRNPFIHNGDIICFIKYEKML